MQILPKQTFNSIVTPKIPGPLPESALRDLTVATIAIKYTQSNSVCYALNGQVVGLGAGQQSRIHCTRLAGEKTDNWWMRFHERTLNLRWRAGIKRAEKANAIDMLCGGLIPKSGIEKDDWEKNFEEPPTIFTQEEREDWIDHLRDVALSSDAFFPFIDNVFRAGRSGVKYVAAPMGSQMDRAVAATCEELGIARKYYDSMFVGVALVASYLFPSIRLDLYWADRQLVIEQSVRLFHH